MDGYNKLIRIVILCFLAMNLNSQNTCYRIDFNKEEYSKVAYENLQTRYLYTLKVKDYLVNELKIDSMLLVTQYDLDSLKIYSIPKFKFNNLNSKGNVLELIDFSNDFCSQKYFVYNNSKIVFDDNVSCDAKISGNNFDKYLFSLISDDYSNPIRYGSLSGYIAKIDFNKFENLFFIKGLENVLFIVEENLVYAIYNIDNNGNYEKLEINKYFSKYDFLGNQRNYPIKYNRKKYLVEIIK
ncbi:hypothetical protein [Flavobacterium sp. J27]|uniref:hypothetical protein n=1 Tax=Flavobacterium sp. J27 TaxID=2060419 RepID=UPI00102FED00|nr:hypothetical protein [Flavobacterium sp. J27]